MSLLDKLERWLGRFAIPHLALWIVAGQFFVLMCVFLGKADLVWFFLVADEVRGGAWWQLGAFIFLPPPPDIIFGYLGIAFAWYMFYLMSNALEGYWGEFRFNAFLLTGYILTIGAVFIIPHSAATNYFIELTVFLAFAWLNPEFTLLLFFILPVKIKWIARLTWLWYFYKFSVSSWPTRLSIAAALGNFLLYFASDIVRTFRYKRRTMSKDARVNARSSKIESRHRCYICGKTDVTNPELDFRYCSKCAGDQCYCPEHIFNHEHVGPRDDSKPG